MKPAILIILVMLLVACDPVYQFRYQPTTWPPEQEGYIVKQKSDTNWEIEMIGMRYFSQEVLEIYFRKKASELCPGGKYEVISLVEKIDVCSSRGCFENAIAGEVKCI